MASRPPEEPPESIILAAFSGLKNTVERERLKLTELETAQNVDLDDAGQPRRRRGFALKNAANYHSIQNLGDRVFGVKNGTLVELFADYTSRSLGTIIGNHGLTMARVGDMNYFSSQTASGKFEDATVTPWGTTDGAGQWVSPVVLDTATLGKIYGKVLKAPPLAEHIAYYRGRIYLASGPYLWATELYLYDHVDKNRNFLQFEDDITMVAPVDDGIYVGTTRNVFFLSGSFGKGMPRQRLMNAGVLPGSEVELPVSAMTEQPETQEGIGVMFMTTSGICKGLPGGNLVNATSGRVEFPSAISAAALYREDRGANAYVAVTDSGGAPKSNVRIGDYVEAELVRAADR